MTDATAGLLLGERDFSRAMDSLDTMFLNGGFKHHHERRRMMAKARRLDRAGQAQLMPGGDRLKMAAAVAAILDFTDELRERRPEARRYWEAAQAAAASAEL